MTADRPKFFSHCPVCNAETPQGAIKCPNCDVDLEIARANALKDVALAAGAYGYAAAQQPKRWNDIAYFFLGLAINVAASVIVYMVLYWNLSLGTYVAIAVFLYSVYLAALGRYGKSTFFGFVNLLVWSFVPILNFVLPFYIGRGTHISFSKLELPNLPVATSVGTIIVGVVLLLGFLSYIGNANSFLPEPTPTRRPPPTFTPQPQP